MKLSSAETELKLALSPSVAKSVFSVSALKRNGAAKPKSQRLVTTYYETREKDLARRGVSLRIRQENEKRIQTVKSVGDSGVANSRGEWEWQVERATPDLGLLKEAPVAKLFADVSEDRLEPAVVTDVVRTTRNLEVETLSRRRSTRARLSPARQRRTFANLNSSCAKERQRRFTDWRSS
jgi:inorganic triphosphatase YgiF